jgi:hypothetical protein
MKKTENRTCPSCGNINPIEVEAVNHVLHLILSLVTGGIWLVVWLLLALGSKKNDLFTCQACGKPFTA